MENALHNEHFYNSLSKEKQSAFIENVYKKYNKTLPLIKHDLKEITKYFEMLKENQTFTFSKNANIHNFKKYHLHSFISYVKNLGENNEKNTTLIDVDYLENYVKYCSLSDFYQNEERVKCCVQYQKPPIEYYEKNYRNILHDYFTNQSK